MIRELLEKVRVTPRSYQDELLLSQSINQKPVRFDMALAAVKILPPECVVSEPRLQLLAACQASDYVKKLRNVLPAPIRLLAVPLELIGSGESSHERSSSFASSLAEWNRRTFPLRAASIARRVAALGSFTSKGNPR